MIEKKRRKAGEDRRVCNQKRDGGNRFNLMLPLSRVCVCVCVLTDLVLLQLGGRLQKNTLSNYLERAPGHWESHYIIISPPTHTHTHTAEEGIEKGKREESGKKKEDG